MQLILRCLIHILFCMSRPVDLNTKVLSCPKEPTFIQIYLDGENLKAPNYF
jgi:hypothetical protein